MSIGEEKEYFGNRYTAVPYEGEPAEYNPKDVCAMFDDNQCRYCAVEPNYCKMQAACHGTNPFIFVKSSLARAMNTIAKPFNKIKK